MTSFPEYEQVVRLPFQVRPRAGEGIRSFIARLAEANCLPPAYLRKYLCEPPQHRGVPTWPRTAAAAGRDPTELRQVLSMIKCEQCGQQMQWPSRYGVKPLTCSRYCREKRRHKNYLRRAFVPCRVCGTKVQRRLGQRRYFCSTRCRRTAFEYRQRREPLPLPPQTNGDPELPDTPELSGTCPVCERPMRRKPQRTACSRWCRKVLAVWTRESPEPETPDSHDDEPTGPPLPAGSMICHNCQTTFIPLRRNLWCSTACMEEAFDRHADNQQCRACGTSIAHRPPSRNPRRWCTATCCQKASRWRAELRERSAQAHGSPHGR